MNNLDSIFKKYNSSIYGLTSTQAKENAKLGINKLSDAKKTSFLTKFFLQFKNLMVIVLLISAIVSTIVSLATKEYGDLFEGGLIFVIVILNAIIGVIQENKAEVALDSLKKLSSPKSKVIRDGKTTIISAEDIVVGDVVLIKNGDYIPADLLLIDSNNLKADESSLTGESLAVYKDHNFHSTENTPLAEKSNYCFSGTNITYGNGKGIVIAVGHNTEIGKIAGITKSKNDKTPLEKNMEHIGKVITYGVLIIVSIVFFAQLIFNPTFNFIQSFLTAIALAVAAIPESLPAVITIIMALGVEKLAKHGAIVKTLSSVETLGSCTCIATDKTGTLTQNKMQVKNVYYNGQNVSNYNEESLDLLFKAITLCNNSTLDKTGNYLGDATETSLMNFAKKHYNMEKNKNCERIYEIPFDSNRKIMSTINIVGNKKYMFCKGATDYLIKRCSHILINNKIEKLDYEQILKISNLHDKFAKSGQRVIAVAYKETDNKEENNLILISLIGIIDPPRDNVKPSIEKCLSAGLKPIMITGDHQATAFAIAKELGIAKSETEVITGSDLDSLSDKQLPKVIKKYSVFARVTPEHKSRIVKALKKSGNIVGFTGDGINDAPSIKLANIGVCMGSGTDFTKSVSDLIISTDDYSTIVLAIEQGRTIFNNIQKVLLFLLSTNIVEVLGIFISTLVIPNSIFLLPSQILFINLVTDSLPAFALGLEKTENNIMQKPPRSTKATIFDGIGWHILLQGFTQTFIVMIMFVFALNYFGNNVASTMVFITICMMQIIHAINCKTIRSITKVNIFSNKTFNISFILLLALILIISLVTPLASMFGLVQLSLLQWLFVALTSISIIPIVEICKFLLNHTPKKHKKLQNDNLSIKNVIKN